MNETVNKESARKTRAQFFKFLEFTLIIENCFSENSFDKLDSDWTRKPLNVENIKYF